MPRLVRIGSRESSLALWQAKFIAHLLNEQGVDSELILVKSEGDINLTAPLYEMGVQGIFTKTLDAALLSDQIDIAVHSLKDVPTLLPAGLQIAAIPERASVRDVLVYKDPAFRVDGNKQQVIATSSLRRKAQWLNRYPNHELETIRGNINTRLSKLQNTQHWDAALFAAAGINRIGLEATHQLALDWMLPAPAQGALGIVCHTGDEEIEILCGALNHPETAFCVGVERAFLRHLRGGCSMPVGALAVARENVVHFTGNILSLDGVRKVEVEMNFSKQDAEAAGKKAASALLEQGGDRIALELKKYMTSLPE
ncbi:MAG TPA: hydroxymethylbilane synthase [Bacteroidia bacterium]|jgi:hydroxymethylbilane synthase|nr:hydroxymethylbilane synthase [Bacteroidia bacterium]